MADVLVDTNVLVYAADPSTPKKQRRAIAVLEELFSARSGMLSSQTLAEYFSVVTGKLVPRISPEQAHSNLLQLTRVWPVKPLDATAVLEAAGAVIHHNMSFWDAQIWAVAKIHGAVEILSEDFTHDQIVEGIRFRNPFQGL